MRNNIILITIIIIIAAYTGYIKYTDNEIHKYVSYYNGENLKNFFKGEISGKAELVRVIKRSPKELIMIIKWDEHTAYVSAKNWLTKAHDNIELRVFDNTKCIKFYE